MRKTKRSRSIGSNVSFEHSLINTYDHENPNSSGGSSTLQSVLSSGADEKDDDATSFASGGLAHTHFQVIFVLRLYTRIFFYIL